MAIQLFQYHLLKKAILSPLNCFCAFLENRLAMCVWSVCLYFYQFHSVLSTVACIWNQIVRVLQVSQNCFNSSFFIGKCKFWNQFVKLYKKFWDFERKWVDFIDQVGKNGHLGIVFQFMNMIYLHFLKFLSPRFSFSGYESCTSFIRLICK